jgi:hypothetical protein
MNSILAPDTHNFDGIDIALHHRLMAELNDTKFVETGNLVVVKGNYKATEEPITDPTGIECRVNKWHVDEFLDLTDYSESFIARLGIRFADALRAKLVATSIPGDFRAIISVSEPFEVSRSPGCTVRCHKRRPGNAWLREDLEGYKSEALAVIDWTNSIKRPQAS